MKMNVVQMKNKLLAGEFPGNENETIRLNDSQIHYLAATVPSVKIYNTNATQYYFPKAKTYLQVIFNAHYKNYNTEGNLFKIDDNYDRLYYKDGIKKFVVDDKNNPVIFKLYDMKMLVTIKNLQATLWMQRKPYWIKTAGYKSIHNKGWPKNEWGTKKTSLSIHNGDFESVYLDLEEISPHYTDWENSLLKEAILNGEYKLNQKPDDFENKIRDRARKQKEKWELKRDFQNFVKSDKIETFNKDVENFNEEIENCKKILKLATELRKIMKANPGWFKKIKRINNNHGLKTSQLYRQKYKLTLLKKARRELLFGDYNNPLYRILKEMK